MPGGNQQGVDLTPLTGGPGNDWTVSHNGQSGNNPSTYPHVQVPHLGGAYLLHFTIQGNNSITFSSDPIWVQANSKPSVHALDSQITAVVRSNTGKELFVLDQNTGNPATLYYRLNFIGHDQVDPIIDNGGSNFWGGLTTAEVMAVSAAVVAFFIGIAVHRFFFARKGVSR